MCVVGIEGTPRVEGNLAKQRVQRRIREVVGAAEGLSILDVGCVGPSPLAMWRWPLDELRGRFRFTGTDVAGIERAEQAARELEWRDARFVPMAPYRLVESLGGERFDVVVCTQVLEHVRRLDRFVGQLAAVLKPGGRAFLTLDSGHFDRRENPVRELGKWLAVRLGRERYHERPLRDDELEPLFAARGLHVAERGYYNLHPLKWVHNHGVSADRRDELAERWYGVERLLNGDEGFIRANKHLFLGLYYELRAPAQRTDPSPRPG
jgi:2-polyprenyl-3-methyl-5-hydroxy-6-metoxy-1,4-benzoquinol methylase